MRIVHAYKVAKPEINGGIPEILETLTIGLNVLGHQNEILTCRTQGWASREVIEGVPVKRSGSFGTVFSLPLSPTYPFALWNAARDADILAVHAPFPLADPVAALLPLGVGVVVHWHSDIIRQKLLAAMLSPIARRMLDRADAIIVSDESIAANTPALQPYLRKTEVIPYGIAIDRWSTDVAEDAGPIATLRQRYPVLFVAIGRLVTYKGFDVLLEAMKQVNGHLVICGEGSERASLEALIRRNNLENRVTLAGMMETVAIRQHLKAATAFVFPSISPAETFGLVQVEAMAAGVPVINTSLTTAVPSVARDGLEAITVPPGNAEALAAAMNRLAGDAGLRAILSTSGRQRAQDRYSSAAFVRAIHDLYERV